MAHRFSRTENLIGKAALERLKNARVAVFGIGGVGGYAAEALARSGVGSIDVVDGDEVCITNINRQIYALTSTIGQYKVDVAERRIKDINPDCTVKAFRVFYTPDKAKEFDFSAYDYVLDAVDTVTAKLSIVGEAERTETPVISAMGAGNKLDPTGFCVADIYETSVCPLARIMRTECKKRGIKKLKVVYSQEKPVRAVESAEDERAEGRRAVPASNAFVPPVVGFIMASEVIKDLIKECK